MHQKENDLEIFQSLSQQEGRAEHSKTLSESDSLAQVPQQLHATFETKSILDSFQALPENLIIHHPSPKWEGRGKDEVAG